MSVESVVTYGLGRCVAFRQRQTLANRKQRERSRRKRERSHSNVPVLVSVCDATCRLSPSLLLLEGETQEGDGAFLTSGSSRLVEGILKVAKLSLKRVKGHNGQTAKKQHAG